MCVRACCVDLKLDVTLVCAQSALSGQSLMKFSFLVFFSVFDSLKRVFIDCRCLLAGIKMRTGRKEYEFESGGLLILHAPNVPCSVAAGVEGLEGSSCCSAERG